MIHLLTGFLVRADGWDTTDPRHARAARFFNVWTCAALFALLCLFYFPPLTALACGLAFVCFRIKGFRNAGFPDWLANLLPRGAIAPVDGWQNWSNMFIRTAVWTALGFTVMACVTGAYGNIWLVLPFAACNASLYGAAHRTSEWSLFGFNKHVYVEHASGWLFSAFLLSLT